MSTALNPRWTNPLAHALRKPLHDYRLNAINQINHRLDPLCFGRPGNNVDYALTADYLTTLDISSSGHTVSIRIVETHRSSDTKGFV